MLLDFLFFPHFLLGLVIVGVGILRVMDGRSYSVADYPSFFYLVMGLFTLGFIALVLNFFMGVNSPVFYSIIGVLFVFGLSQTKHMQWHQLRWMLVLGLLLCPLTASMGPHNDAGLYHIPHQMWIRDEKIVFGLTHLHYRLGFASFLEYISSALWIGDTLTLLIYLAASFAVILFLFLTHMLRSDHKITMSLGLLLVLSLILSATSFRFRYTGTDIPAGVMFIVSIMWGWRLLVEERAVSRYDLVILFLCGLFAFMAKTTVVFVFVWIAFVCAGLLVKKRVSLPVLLKASVFPDICLALWLLRNVIISGCVLFPVSFTCIGVPWAAPGLAVEAVNDAMLSARRPIIGATRVEGNAWVIDWWLPKHAFFLGYTALTILIVCIVYRRFFARSETSQPYAAPFLLAFLWACVAVWFFTAPVPRFGLALFVLLPVATAVAFMGYRQYASHPTFARGLFGPWPVLLLACAFGILGLRGRFDDFKPWLNMLTQVPAKVKPVENFGVEPVEGTLCWAAKDCGQYPLRPPIHEAHGYRYFLPLEQK